MPLTFHVKDEIDDADFAKFVEYFTESAFEEEFKTNMKKKLKKNPGLLPSDFQ
jgi:hypothetical protein